MRTSLWRFYFTDNFSYEEKAKVVHIVFFFFTQRIVTIHFQPFSLFLFESYLLVWSIKRQPLAFWRLDLDSYSFLVFVYLCYLFSFFTVSFFFKEKNLAQDKRMRYVFLWHGEKCDDVLKSVERNKIYNMFSSNGFRILLLFFLICALLRGAHYCCGLTGLCMSCCLFYSFSTERNQILEVCHVAPVWLYYV